MNNTTVYFLYYATDFDGKINTEWMNSITVFTVNGNGTRPDRDRTAGI